MYRMYEVRDKYGEDYLLRQLAEECCELGQAALKMVRARNGETPVRETEAREKLIEELADVQVMVNAICTTMLSDEEQECEVMIESEKEERMYSRMLDGVEEECIW